jgi:TM2 domain-containing membrane protein YozV
MNVTPNALPEFRGGAVHRKSAGLAAVLSIFPGLGQIYVGAIRRGFTYAAIFGGLIVLLSSGAARGIEPAVGIMMAFFYFYNLIDAARMANLFNEMASGITPEEWRRDFLAGVGQRGSIGGGLALLVGGVLFLLHTWFDVSLEWISEWWPLLPVGVGAWLLWAGIRDRARSRSSA